MIDDRDCMLWAGSLRAKGYAQVTIWNTATKKWTTAALHRELYYVEKGEIPDGYVLDHLCRNRSCINTDHLEPVTNTENLNRGDRPNVWGTHCNNGHPVYPGSYTFLKKNSRRCRKCHALYMKKWRDNRVKH